jgi:type IV pilus assembly protein PilA
MKSSGFTLIELMIVIAIIGILAVFAIPAYQDYVARSQSGEAYSLTAGIKNSVREIYIDEGVFATANSGYQDIPSAGSVTGNYTSQVAVSSGVIVATLGEEASSIIAGQTVTLSPYSVGGTIRWSCEFSGLQRHAPKACRNP